MPKQPRLAKKEKKFGFRTFGLKSTSESGPKAICPKTERVRILDVDCTVKIHKPDKSEFQTVPFCWDCGHCIVLSDQNPEQLG